MKNPLDISKSNKKKRFVTGIFAVRVMAALHYFPDSEKHLNRQNIIHVSPPFNKTKTWTDLPFVLKPILN